MLLITTPIWFEVRKSLVPRLSVNQKRACKLVMAEDTAQDEKTEEPTARRMEKAREEGQVLRSQDLTVAVVTAGFIGSLYALSSFMGPAITRVLNESFQILPESLSESSVLVVRFAAIFAESFLILTRSSQLRSFSPSEVRRS